MKEKLEAISKMSKVKIAEIKDSQALNDFKVKVLGKKGELTEILRGMKDIAADERPVVGNCSWSFFLPIWCLQEGGILLS